MKKKIPKSPSKSQFSCLPNILEQLE